MSPIHLKPVRGKLIVSDAKNTTGIYYELRFDSPVSVAKVLSVLHPALLSGDIPDFNLRALFDRQEFPNA